MNSPHAGYLRCAAPKVRSLPKQQQSNERFITFYKKGQTNVQDREVKRSILIFFPVIIVVSIHPPYRMIYSPITLLKGWIPLEHELLDTECSKDYGGQDFVADWTLSLSVMVNKYIEHLPRNSKTSTSQIHTRTRKLGLKLIWDDLSVSKNGVHSPPKNIWVVPTLTHYSDIVSDIPSGSMVYVCIYIYMYIIAHIYIYIIIYI